MRGGNAVEPAHDADALAQRDDRGRIGADVAQVRAAQRQERPARVERQFGLADEIAALVIAEESFAALARPFHRAADFFRSPHQHGMLRKHRILGAEIAADVAGNDADGLEGNVEDFRDLALLPNHAAAAGVKRVALGRGVETADSGARFHRHAGDALNPSAQRDDVGGAGKGSVRRRSIAHLGIKADIRRRVVPQARRARIGCRGRVGHRGQCFVFDLDELGAILCGGNRFGNNHGHGLADIANPILRQQRIRTVEDLGTVGIHQDRIRQRALEFQAAEKQEIGRNGLEAIGLNVDAGQHANDARGRAGGLRIDADNSCMRMRRAQHGRIGLVRQA